MSQFMDPFAAQRLGLGFGGASAAGGAASTFGPLAAFGGPAAFGITAGAGALEGLLGAQQQKKADKERKKQNKIQNRQEGLRQSSRNTQALLALAQFLSGANRPGSF